jgi:hypothetical protein
MCHSHCVYSIAQLVQGRERTVELEERILKSSWESDIVERVQGGNTELWDTEIDMYKGSDFVDPGDSGLDHIIRRCDVVLDRSADSVQCARDKVRHLAVTM